MGDLQKREDDSLTRHEDEGVSKVVYWAVVGIALLAIGVLVVVLGPWLLAGAGVLFAIWLTWRIVQWWNADDDASDQALITDETSPEAELDSQIALEDLRKRAQISDDN